MMIRKAIHLVEIVAERVCTTLKSAISPASGLSQVSDVRIERGEYAHTSGTFTGLKRLPLRKCAIESASFDGYSPEEVSFSFGVSHDGIPPRNSVETESRFVSEHFAAAAIGDTTEKKIFLTFDLGSSKCREQVGRILDILLEKDIPAAFFSPLRFVKRNPSLTDRIIRGNHILGNHSVSHKPMGNMPPEEVLSEVMTFERFVRRRYGYCARYFRFPLGVYSDRSLKIVGDAGYFSVFWSLAYDDFSQGADPSMDVAQLIASRLHPGAIILLHAGAKRNVEALERIIDSAQEMGYTFAPLTDISRTQE